MLQKSTWPSKRERCIAGGGTVEAIFGREPGRTWVKTGFVKVLVQSGTERDPRLPDSPTIWEIMDKEKVPESSKRLATVVLAAGFFGRPIVGPPGMASDRLKILRESYLKTMTDPDFSAEAKKRRWELTPVSGEKLEARAKRRDRSATRGDRADEKALGKLDDSPLLALISLGVRNFSRELLLLGRVCRTLRSSTRRARWALGS